MSTAKSQVTAKDQAPPAPVVSREPETPAKVSGPQRLERMATASASSAPNGGASPAPPRNSASQSMPTLNRFTTSQGGRESGPRAQLMKRLQRQIGNARLNRLLTESEDNAPAKSTPDGIQRFTVSHPEDDAEKEAEAVSRQVTSGQDAPPISRLPTTNIHTLLPSDREDKLTRAPQEKADNDADADPSTAAHAISHKDAGSPVDSSLRSTLEPRMGTDLSGARVHNDNTANKAADSINARAFTHGSDIFLGTGESATDTRLMAHELTHVVQQAPESTVARAKKPKAPVELEVAPEVLELKGTQGFPAPILQFFEEHKGKEVIVNARFGQIAQGQLKVKVDRKGKFTIKPQPLALTHPVFARAGDAAASLSLIVQSSKTGIGGYIGPAAAAENSKALEKALEKAPDLIGLAGFTMPDITLTNKLENGQLNLGFDKMGITLGAAFSGKISLQVVDENIERLEGQADVAVQGLGTGSLELKRQKEGVVTGKATVNLQLPANFKGAVDVAWDGEAITGEGKVGYTGEKLSGEVTLKLMEKGEAAQLEKEKKAPPEQLEADKKPAGAAKKPATKPKKIEYVVFGEGDLNFAFNEWLNGTAHVIVDPKGYVTIIGEITPQKEFELFKPDDVVKPLFSFEARASYGIPVVGNIFIYGKLSMDAFAKLGPAKLYNISVKGNYSTDPEKNKEFTIQGSINISAAAGVRMRAEAGAGIEILSHDIKAGAGINGIAGIKAYAEATPVIGYREKGAPGEDKKGEFFISGTLEIAAQPFVGLSGDLFIELDTPWWSPLDDDRWTWPLFNKEYPLGGTLGTRVSVDHVLGSKQLPSVEFQPVEFDSSKFMTDLYNDRTKPKSGEAKDQPAQWQEKNDASAAPPAVDGAKGNAKPGTAGELPPAKSSEAGGPKTKGKAADPNERTAEGKSVKELQDEAEKKGHKPDGPQPAQGAVKDEAAPGEKKDPVEQQVKEDPGKLLDDGLAELDQRLDAAIEGNGLTDSESGSIIESVKTKYKFKVLEIRQAGDEAVLHGEINPGRDKKKDLRKLGVKASVPLARLIENPATRFPRVVALAIDRAQVTMNDLYRPAGDYGDKSCAFMAMKEQFEAGVGKDPVPLKGTTRHALKCEEYCTGLEGIIKSLAEEGAQLPKEAIERIEAEIEKMKEALEWAESFRAGNNPDVPKWAKPYRSELGH